MSLWKMMKRFFTLMIFSWLYHFSYSQERLDVNVYTHTGVNPNDIEYAKPIQIAPHPIIYYNNKAPIAYRKSKTPKKNKKLSPFFFDRKIGFRDKDGNVYYEQYLIPSSEILITSEKGTVINHWIIVNEKKLDVLDSSNIMIGHIYKKGSKLKMYDMSGYYVKDIFIPIN